MRWAPRRRISIPLIVAVVSLGVSVAGCVVAYDRAKSEAVAKQTELTNQSASVLHASVLTLTNQIKQFAQALSEVGTPRPGESKSFLTKAAFDRNVKPLLDTPTVAAVSFVAGIPDEARTRYERQYGRIMIALPTTPPTVAPAPVHDLYLVTTFTQLSPLAGRQATDLPPTIDLSGNDDVAAAIDASFKEGAPRSTVPVQLPVESKPLGINIYMPVMEAGDTITPATAKLIGYVGVSLLALPKVMSKGTGLPSEFGEQLSVDGHQWLAPEKPLVHAVHAEVDGGAFGRTWSVALGRPGIGYVPVIVTAVIGLVITTLLTMLSWLVSRRERLARGEVTERVAERDAAEASRLAIEHRLGSVFAHTPTGMALVDLDGRFVSVNRALSTITGYDVEWLEGNAVTDIVPVGDRPQWPEAVTALVNGTLAEWSAERRVLHAAGHTVWVSVELVLLRDADDRPELLLASVQDITDRRDYEDRLRYLADHDPLTGLLNRRSFEAQLNRTVAESERYGSTGSLLVIDLDHFKLVNDSAGHHDGDELITRVATGLREKLNDTDIVARLGGDEYAVLLPRADATEAAKVGESLLHMVRTLPVTRRTGGTRSITASIGIATIDGRRVTAEDLLINADIAMYEAKERGRDRIAHYRDNVYGDARLKSRISWVDRLQDALDHDAFELFAQPIQSLATNRVVSYELLIRMRAVDSSIVPPAAFLDAAERFDMITHIDQWVVSTALRSVAELRAIDPALAVSINLSGKSIGDARTLAIIEHEIASHHVDPAAITFEVTETSAVADLPRAQRFAERLHDLGCRVALDDFGSGYGNFFYLKHLPFDYIKVDGEYVRGAASSSTDRLVVEAVAGIARGMGKMTVAEYVSDEIVLELMREIGIDLVQGFHVGSPKPLREWITASAPASVPTG